MDLDTYESLIKSESSARRFLLGQCWNNHQRFCPRCRERKLYRLRDGRRRCGRCGYTFHDFTRRWLNEAGLTPGQWLRLVKLFELEVGPGQAAEQLGLAYNTVYKALCTVRRAILAQAPDAAQYYGPEAVLPEVYTCPRASADAPADRIPVFGLCGNNGDSRAVLLPDMWAETVYFLNLKTASLGRIVYTDRYRDYDALVFCGESYLCRGRRHEGGVHVDGAKGFWSFAKDRFARMSGVSPLRFPLYLKELEFRHQNRGADVFALVARALCAFVPTRDQSPSGLQAVAAHCNE